MALRALLYTKRGKQRENFLVNCVGAHVLYFFFIYYYSAYHLKGVVQLIFTFGQLFVRGSQSIAQPFVLHLAFLP